MELLSSLLKTLSLMSQWSYYQVCSKQMDHHSTISQLWGMIAGLTWSSHRETLPVNCQCATPRDMLSLTPAQGNKMNKETAM
jgi:hypothetical protein